jgi:hypothetical protein
LPQLRLGAGRSFAANTEEQLRNVAGPDSHCGRIRPGERTPGQRAAEVTAICARAPAGLDAGDAEHHP